MAPASRRRSRSVLSDGDSDSRASTPISTAPDDTKRARRINGINHSDHRLRDANRVSEDDWRQSTPSATDAMISSTPVQTNGHRPGRPSHQPGAIVRVKLTNFVTYSSAEFFPGPNLNMVIGPNGTGKSTLVCAICLGLGWGPQYLGRAKDVAEFVKHGCREATIEIELQRATEGEIASESNPIITRTIRREGNKSTFTLNDGHVSGKAVMSLAQSYNIQIDNLCQFLPQDKVVEFAQMTPIQILESTQKAAAPPEMLQHHSDLIDLRKQQKEHSNDHKGAREQLANLENRQEMQRTEVERLRERAITQKKLGWLEMCRPIPRFGDARKTLSEARAKRKETQVELKKLKDESGPTLKKVNAKQDYVKQVQGLQKDIDKEMRRAAGECARIEIEIKNLEEEMKDCEDHAKSEAKSEISIKKEVARQKLLFGNLRSQKEKPPEELNYRAINQEINDKTSQVRQLEEQYSELLDEMRTLKSQGVALRPQRDELQKRIDKCGTLAGQQEAKLEEFSKEVHRAWTWIQENQDRFRQQVYGPPIVECSLTEPSRAQQIEALLQANDFKAFTAQNTEDFRLLQRELIDKQMLSDISLRVCNLTSLDLFPSPLSAEQMSRHGLDGWVLDYIQGPATVVAMLCQERFLHQAAVAHKDLSEEQFKALESTAVKNCVSPAALYRFSRRAEYGAAGVTSERREWNRKPKFWSGQSSDQGRKAQLEAKLLEVREQSALLRDELESKRAPRKAIMEEISEINAAIQELQDAKSTNQEALVAFRSIDAKMSQAEAKITKGEADLASIKERVATHQEQKDVAMFAKADAALRYVGAVHELQARHRDLLSAQVMLIEARNDFETLSARNQHIVDLIKTKEDEVGKAGKHIEKMKKEAHNLIPLVERVQEAAKELEQSEGDRGLRNMMEEMADLQKTSGFTEKDLDDKIDVETAKLDLTEGGDDNLIKEYEDRAKKVARLRSKVSAFSSRQQQLLDAINEVRRVWEPQLDRLVAEISDAFSDSFARIGCAGQVAIHKPSSDDPVDCDEAAGGADNGLDFENWAIHISVKFRANEPLRLLDSHRQSGGERAVSTIFYLMALQSLSRAPFRVVDEINQGMDPRNERMVHGRMVDIAAAGDDGHRDGSQYFLITPKLLSGLKYKPGMTVLCIVSGENMPSPLDTKARGADGQWLVEAGKKIDFGSFASTARALGLARGRASRLAMNAGQTTEVGA